MFACPRGELRRRRLRKHRSLLCYYGGTVDISLCLVVAPKSGSESNRVNRRRQQRWGVGFGSFSRTSWWSSEVHGRQAMSRVAVAVGVRKKVRRPIFQEASTATASPSLLPQTSPCPRLSSLPRLRSGNESGPMVLPVPPSGAPPTPMPRDPHEQLLPAVPNAKSR